MKQFDISSRTIRALLAFAAFAAILACYTPLCVAQEDTELTDKPISETESRLLRQIEEAVAAGDTDEAMLLMAKALVYIDDPERQARVYVSRGHLNLRLGRTDEALEDLDAAVRLAPEDPVPAEARGIAYYQLKRLGLAIPDLDRALDLGTTEPAAYTARGNLYLDYGNPMGALAAYDRALDLDPTYTEATFQRGYVYSRLGHFDLAVEAFNQVVAEFPEQAFPYNNRGIVHSQAGREAESLADFNKAVELDSNYASAWSNLGYTEFLLGNVDAALSAYDKSDDLEKDNPYCLCNRVEAYFRMGEKLKARGALKKCLKAAGQNTFFQREEAYYIAALEMLKKYIDEENDLPSAEFLYDKAAEAWKAEKRKYAFTFYSLAYMLDPDDSVPLYRLGVLSERLGRRSYAITFLSRYLAKHPDDEYAESARDILESLVVPLPPPPGMDSAQAPLENAQR